MKIRSILQLQNVLNFSLPGAGKWMLSMGWALLGLGPIYASAQEALPINVLAQQYAAGLNLNLGPSAAEGPDASSRAARRWQVLQSWAVEDAVEEEISKQDKSNPLDNAQTPSLRSDLAQASPASSSPSAPSSSFPSSSFINWQEDFTLYAPPRAPAGSAAEWAAVAVAEDLDFSETLAVFYQTLTTVQHPFQVIDEPVAAVYHWPKLGPENINKFFTCLKKLKPHLAAAQRGDTKALVYFNQTRTQKSDFYCGHFLGVKLAVPEEDLMWNVQYLNEIGLSDERDLALGYLLNAYSTGEDPATQRWWQLAWQVNFQYWMLGKTKQVLPGEQLHQIFAHAPQGMTSLSGIQRINALESGLHYITAQGLDKSNPNGRNGGDD